MSWLVKSMNAMQVSGNRGQGAALLSGCQRKREKTRKEKQDKGNPKSYKGRRPSIVKEREQKRSTEGVVNRYRSPIVAETIACMG